MLPYIISLITIICLLIIYKSKFSDNIKLLVYVVMFVECFSLLTIFVDYQSVFGGKYPLIAILPVFFVLGLLIYKVIKTKKVISTNYERYSFEEYFLHFRIAGLSFIFTIIFLEFYIFDGHLSSNSFFIIIFGLYLIFYHSISTIHADHKMMILLFFGFYSLFYPISTLFTKIFVELSLIPSTDYYTDYIVYNFLGKPLVNLLSILGFKVWASGNTIYYTDLTLGLSSSVSIATGCTGIDSVIIFSCAFFSFLYVEYSILDKRTFLLFSLGLFIAYFANLLRMSIIILSGHYWGHEALESAHENAGWLIFTIWIFIFWNIINWFYTKSLFKEES